SGGMVIATTFLKKQHLDSIKSEESFMDKIKVWPHMTIVAVVVALIAGFGVAFWMKHEQTASAEELYAARIQRVDGEVAFSDGQPIADANGEWIAATPNQPVSVGD